MKIPLFFFFIGLLAISFAATGHAQQMMIGARAGVNLANEQWSNLGYGENVSIKPGVLAGGQLDYWFNHSWSMSIQLLYDQKGAHALISKFVYGVSPNDGTADWTTSYLEIPLLAKVNLNDGAIRPYLFAGPSIGFLISNNESYYSTTANITDSTKKVDLSIVAGAGISLMLSSGAELFLDAGYAFGLMNTDNYYQDKNYLSIYSRDIRIATGVLFPIR